MKKVVIFIGLSLILFGCHKPVIKEGIGTYRRDGETATAKIKTKNDKLVEVEIDETAKGKDQTKKELGSAYNMKQASPIQKEWNEQVDYFEKYVEKHGLDNVKLNSAGEAENNDVKSGCTIAVDGYIKAIHDAQQKLK